MNSEHVGKKNRVQYVVGHDINVNTIFHLVSAEGVVALSQTAINAMLSYRQNGTSTPESGGILIGRKLIDNEGWIIDSITEPAKSDKRSRFHFFRSITPHQQAIDQAWYASDGTIGYLGEWHTHPEADPSPSRTDLYHWKKAMREFKYDGNHLFFAIMGTSSLSLFQGLRCTGQVVQLKPQKHNV